MVSEVGRSAEGVAVVAAVAAAAALACGPLSAETVPPPAPAAPQPAELANSIGLKFSARAAETGNIFFSPYGLYSAFSMVYDCARENTAAEIRGVFGFPEDRDILRTETVLLRRGAIKAVKGAEFGRVNSFWYQKGYEFLPDYEEVLKSSHSASGETADFRSSAERARSSVNAWTKKQTGGRITDVLEQGAVTQLTRLALVSAVYFKGQWKRAFGAGGTAEQDFTLPGGGTVKAQLMASTEPANINYYEDEELQAAGLDYTGGRLRMLVLLPAAGHSAAAIGKALTPERLAEIKKAMAARLDPAVVYLPRFKFASSWDLAAGLSAMGMPQAFTDAADLSGMTGRKGLYLQKAVQKAYIEVSEQGAAAPAAPTRKKRGKKPLVFRADRPFIFLIEDKFTGLIFFIGRVDDPSLAV